MEYLRFSIRSHVVNFWLSRIVIFFGLTQDNFLFLSSHSVFTILRLPRRLHWVRDLDWDSFVHYLTKLYWTYKRLILFTTSVPFALRSASLNAFIWPSSVYLFIYFICLFILFVYLFIILLFEAVVWTSPGQHTFYELYVLEDYNRD